ncbi:hypothetical protein OH828_33165 [Streptomyces anulatus]|uniref:hypothetical protein n=1 Tax=Streptomyces anulatus TaxID=1892 RepID=UPI00386F7F21
MTRQAVSRSRGRGTQPWPVPVDRPTGTRAARSSAGRMHGFESMEERAALLALDFMTVIEVLPQPFTLRFEHDGGHVAHGR